ncbi:hypothetical protein V2J09_010120 [Rumex salicifolius]
MPCLNITTNVNLEGVDTSAILTEATASIAKLLSKPENFVMVVIKGSVPISFGGSQDPAAFGELISIGSLNPDTNKQVSAALSAILESKLSVPKNRFYLSMSDKQFFGWNGTVFGAQIV